MKKLIFSLLSLTLAISLFPQTVFGVAQITSPIIFENVMRGQEAKATLSLLNTLEEDAVYELYATGEISEWAHFYDTKDRETENPITEVTVPAGSYFDVTVLFSVPDDTPNGVYKGQAVVKEAPKKDLEDTESTATSNVFRSVGRAVTVNVTDVEVFALDTAFIPESYDVRAGKPLKIRVVYDNQGNVAIEPEIKLTILKDGESLFNASYSWPSSQEAVKPQEIREAPIIEWATAGQENGIYRAELVTMLNGEVVDTDDFKFTIGLLGGSFFGAIAAIGGGNIWIALAIIVAVLAIIVITFKMRRRRRVVA